jgi:glycosyltransferase involved in cell wall biosynthesis
MMKVWLLTTEYPPFSGGGISTYCMHTVTMLAEKSVDITVFLCDRNTKGITVGKENGIRVVRFSPFEYNEKNFLGYETLVSFAFAQVIRSFIRDEDAPDIIESQEYNGIAYFCLLYKKLLYPEFQRPVFTVTIHAPSFICQPFNNISSFKLPYYWIHEMERFCLQAADHIIAPSRYIIDLIKKDYCRLNSSYSVIRNPFYFKKVNAESHVINRCEFVFYGKASPLKGIFELLRYFEILWNEKNAFVLRLIGGTDHFYHPGQMLMDDMIRKRYAKYIASRQLILEGAIPAGELNKRINSANAIIFPSLVDNFPYAVLECMAAGKVVLASTSGGHREIINDGENGFLFEVENEGGFYAKLDEILHLTDEQIYRISENAKNTVSKTCGPEQIVKEKLALFQQLSSRTEETHIFPFLRQEQIPEYIIEKVPLIGLLSVIIPYYNMGDFVEETVKSIFNADYKNIEIIIVNDGSTDAGSLEILKKMCSNNAVKVFNIVNGGLARARNYGALQAKGEFLAFLDADDTVEPFYYSKAIRLLQHYENVFFVGSWVKYFGMRKGIWPCFTPEPPFLLVHNMANTSGMVYKRYAFLNKGLNDPKMIFGMEDYESMINMVGSGYNGLVIPEPLFNYRVRKDSMVRQFTKEKILYMLQLITGKHAVLFGKYADTVTGLLNSNGPGYSYDNPTLDYHIESNKIIRLLSRNRIFQQLRQSKYFRKPLLQLYHIFKKNHL